MLAQNGKNSAPLSTLTRVHHLVEGFGKLQLAELEPALYDLLSRLAELREGELDLDAPLPLVQLRRQLQLDTLSRTARQQLMLLLNLLLVNRLLLDGDDLNGLLDLLGATLNDELLARSPIS